MSERRRIPTDVRGISGISGTWLVALNAVHTWSTRVAQNYCVKLKPL